MAPYNHGVLYHRRDDDSVSAYYHPALIFFGLLVLCGCIMVPMFWMLWLLRNDNRDDVMTEEQVHRARNRQPVKYAEQQQQFVQHPVVQSDGGAMATENDQARRSNDLPKLRKLAISTQKAVASQTQLLWNKMTQALNNIVAHSIPHRRRRSRSRTGVSIDLPIMRQPAWQKLASGSVGVTPSTTHDDFSKPATAEIDMVERAGPSGHCQLRDSGSRVDQGLLGQHKVVDGTTGVEPQKPQTESTVGLAIG